MDINELYGIFKKSSGVATDSRTIRGGELFFALKGENFDGNEYALKALEAGAGHAVVSSSSPVAGQADASGGRIIPVEDTLKTLQELARWHRSMTFVDGKPLTVIGLTGTNGKTTTKELIKAVLSRKFNVTATEGNLNNSIGVPLTLLKIDSRTQIAVVEMGASHPGDIKELVSICLPDYGLITNVGKAHLLGFGSFEGVKKTKGELYDYIQRTADRVFLNVDNRHLCQMASERPDLSVIRYGAAYQNVSIFPATAEHPYLRLSVPSGSGAVEIDTHLVGSYNVDNVMAAIAVGTHFGISLDDAAAAIGEYVPVNNRSQMTVTGKNTLIIDSYNANPASMEAALSNFSGIAADRKIVMLGDMLELGEDSLAEHRKVVDMVRSMRLSAAYFVGEEFSKAISSWNDAAAPVSGGKAVTGISPSHTDAGGSACVRCFGTSEELASFAAGEKISGYTILVKGSRGTRMEKVIPCL